MFIFDKNGEILHILSLFALLFVILRREK